MYYSKKICIFVSHLFGKYQQALCQGIITRAMEYGYLVDIFSSNEGENLGKYDLGEKSILRIPNFQEYSGIVFASNTYLLSGLKDMISKEIRSKSNCPVIEVSHKSDFFPRIALDNNSAIGDIVEHLIKVHKAKRICYLGNGQESIFSNARFDAYKQVMEEHDIKVSSRDYSNSDYSTESIKKALDSFLASDIKPDAIVCYNDRMALTLMRQLLIKGYKIPEDIMITGCDKLEEGQNLSPTLTTLTFPIYEMGNAAIEELVKGINGEPMAARTIVKAKPHYAGSCGCEPSSSVVPTLYVQKLVNHINNTELSMLADINMSSALQGITDIDKGMDMLEKYVGQLDNCKELYICLYNDWNSIHSNLKEISFYEEDDNLSEESRILKLAVRDGIRLQECSFSSKRTLPEYLNENGAPAYIYSPLYFNDREFGYIAIAYKFNKLSYSFDFLTWMRNVNSLLKSILDSNNFGILVNRLEDIYMKDSLTDLYSLQGFKRLADIKFKEAKLKKQRIAALAFNLDGLKNINRTLGHQEGNFAIKILGQGIRNALDKEAIGCRLGGDEFYILLPLKEEYEIHTISQKVQAYINNYNKLNTKNYTISFRMGFYIWEPSKAYDFEEIFNGAERAERAEKR
ncbi:GGDEF domain-containing protein [Alloiococcus sp. CFN-8]|uniref:substrate-binding and GGDEF domain-containing protein n=1 Tax=Alloiococcus sp. CFN-8 TaxID=3416081 RepID=UPI003CF1B5EE